jgi:hypothetical protein
MSHAYTPGLKVTENFRLRKQRILPLKGDVLVEAGAAVGPDDVVAETFLPGDVQICNVANQLGVDQAMVPGKMLKKEGDEVEQGEVIARSSAFFGLFKSSAQAPITGTIESISSVTGQVIIRGEPKPVQVKAYVRGKVVEVIPDEGVVVETFGTFIQGIFGVGGETFGELAIACDDPGQVLTPDHIKAEYRHKVVVGGSLVTAAALRKAIKHGVAGIVVGGFDDQDLRAFLGYDLGVAITGHEDLGITVIVTEGFGQIDMAPRTFDLLCRHAGSLASINGATQIRAGVIRPEVVIPVEGAEYVRHAAQSSGALGPGTPLRIIRAPHFGKLGTVTDLPPEPRALESGSKARVVGVKLEDGSEVVVPRANVEIIED